MIEDNLIPLRDAAADHQRRNGSKGIPRDLLKAVLIGEIAVFFGKVNKGGPSTSICQVSPHHLAAYSRPERLLSAVTFEDTPHSVLADFIGDIAYVDRAELQNWRAQRAPQRASKKPQQEAARRAVKEIYGPHGPPANERDKVLINKVRAHIKKNLPADNYQAVASEESILRATGRRRD